MKKLALKCYFVNVKVIRITVKVKGDTVNARNRVSRRKSVSYLAWSPARQPVFPAVRSLLGSSSARLRAAGGRVQTGKPTLAYGGSGARAHPPGLAKPSLKASGGKGNAIHPPCFFTPRALLASIFPLAFPYCVKRSQNARKRAHTVPMIYKYNVSLLKDFDESSAYMLVGA